MSSTEVTHTVALISISYAQNFTYKIAWRSTLRQVHSELILITWYSGFFFGFCCSSIIGFSQQITGKCRWGGGWKRVHGHAGNIRVQLAVVGPLDEQLPKLQLIYTDWGSLPAPNRCSGLRLRTKLLWHLRLSAGQISLILHKPSTSAFSSRAWSCWALGIHQR